MIYTKNLAETLTFTDVGIILKGQGEVIIATNTIKPILVSTYSDDYE